MKIYNHKNNEKQHTLITSFFQRCQDVVNVIQNINVADEEEDIAIADVEPIEEDLHFEGFMNLWSDTSSLWINPTSPLNPRGTLFPVFLSLQLQNYKND